MTDIRASGAEVQYIGGGPASVRASGAEVSYLGAGPAQVRLSGVEVQVLISARQRHAYRLVTMQVMRNMNYSLLTEEGDMLTTEGDDDLILEF